MRITLLSIVFFISFLNISRSQSDLNIHPDLIPLLDKNLAPFYHGVASGDPDMDKIILWTKITLPKSIGLAYVSWEIATDSNFKNIERSGFETANAVNDFTIKADVEGLTPATSYYYRFGYNGKYSITGQTKTFPKNPVQYSIAFAACSNYEWGYFNNYRFIAEDKDIDLVVHLGDYIYEYAPNVYGDTSMGRVNVPAKEITTLDDYRTRYSLYRLDKDLMKLHQLKPMITTWDDHEIANNGYVEGAQNHQANEGNWATRKSVGKQAYYEWLPIRDNSYHELYRSFKIGSLLELIMLDTRIAGRSQQVASESDPLYNDTSRTILGSAQYNWLLERLRYRASEWKIIGNQVPFGPMFQPDFKGKADKYMDGWDGYPNDRKKLLKIIDKEDLKNIVWITGDYHCSFALENDPEGTFNPKDNGSVEFVVTSITSANDDEGMPRDSAIAYQKDYLKFNPHCKYVNNVDNGYVVVKIEHEQVTTSFYYAETVKKPSNVKRKEKTFVVNNRHNVLTVPEE